MVRFVSHPLWLVLTLELIDYAINLTPPAVSNPLKFVVLTLQRDLGVDVVFEIPTEHSN